MTGPALSDYLEFDADQAIRQWRAVLTRGPLPTGQRQESFRPIEVILCFGLFRILDPRRFGGSNYSKLPPAVLTLARTLHRSANSLLQKMLNLSFDRPHGGRLEPEVFLRLSCEPDRFLRLYGCILSAARGLGLVEQQVPDFLGIASTGELLGQEELTSADVGKAIEDHNREPGSRRLREWFGEQPTERILEQKVRLGQHRFAAAVLDEYDHRCGFCGFSPVGLRANGMLLASHVKPWAACANDRERLDPRNGIAACPLHDRAFDNGLLAVNGGLRIHRARDLQLRLAVENDRVTESFFGPGVLQERLLVPEGHDGPSLRYLDYHREHIFGRRA